MILTVTACLVSFLIGHKEGLACARHHIKKLRDKCTGIDGEDGGLISYRTLDRAVADLGGQAKIYVKPSRD